MSHYRNCYDTLADLKEYKEYKGECVKEIEKLKRNNDISIDDIELGDILVLHDCFFEKSKVKTPGSDLTYYLYENIMWGDFHSPSRAHNFYKRIGQNKKVQYEVTKINRLERQITLGDNRMYRNVRSIKYFQKLKLKRKLIIERLM